MAIKEFIRPGNIFIYRQNTLEYGGNVTSAGRSSIEDFLALFPSSYETLPYRGFTPAQLKMSEYILDISSELLQQTLNEGHITSAQLKNYSDKAVKPVNELLASGYYASRHLIRKLINTCLQVLRKHNYTCMYFRVCIF